MAKQNFLGGGYYGKLGVTVGQRWKNKRTIRSYVIPQNPRTAKQQANRGQFGSAVPLSQLALQMNYKATCFEHESMTRWNYRMRTARNLQDLNSQDLDLIPLAPTDFSPPYTITKMSIASIQTNSSIVFDIQGNVPQSDRVLSVLFHIFSSTGADLGRRLYQGYLTNENPTQITVNIDNTSEINEHCVVRVVSSDDVNSSTDMILSPMLNVEAPQYDERDFNTTINNIQKTLNNIVVVFNEPYKETAISAFSGSVYAVSKGRFETIEINSATLNNNGGYFAVTIPTNFTYSQEILAFAEGSNITVTNVLAESSTFRYTKENETITYSDTDLARTISPNFTFETSEVLKNRVFFPMYLGTVTENITGAINCSGRFDDHTEVSTALLVRNWGSGQAEIDVDSIYQDYPMRNGDYIKVPAFSVSVNSVSYSLQNSVTVDTVNSMTSSDYLVNSATLSFEKNYESGETLVDLRIRISNLVLTGDHDDTKAAPQPIRIAVQNTGGTHQTEPMDIFDIYSDDDGGTILLQFAYDMDLTTPLNSVIYWGQGDGYFIYKDIEYNVNQISLPPILSDWED